MMSKKVVIHLPPIFGRGSGSDLFHKRRFMVGPTVWVLSVLLVMMLGWGDSALAATSTANTTASTTSTASPSSKSTSRSSTTVTSDLAAVPAMPPDIEQILDRGKLIVAVLGQDNAPFFMDREGQLSGLDLKLARSLAEQLGVSLEVTRSAQTF
ncbi:MAG: hypothetical protein AAFW95_13100, partial [Cyanobacteria bacterium J06638_6]